MDLSQVGNIRTWDRDNEAANQGHMGDEVIRLCHPTNTPQPEDNTHLPIHQLSNELLGEIFRETVYGSSKVYSQFTEREYEWPKPLLHITHVCRRWRSVTICHKLLWTRIQLTDTTGPYVASLFAERAGDCPIDVWSAFGSWRQWSSFVPGFLASHAYHTRSLDRFVIHPSMVQVLEVLSFPRLEIFHVYFSSKSAVSRSSSTMFSVVTMPQLQRLFCSKPPRFLAQTLPGFVMLRSLHIDSPVEKLSPSSWASHLKACVHLEELQLIDVFDPSASHDAPDHSVACFPRLRSLVIGDDEDDGENLLQFLRCCTFPGTVELDIAAGYSEDYTHFFSSLSAIASGLTPVLEGPPPKFESCCITDEGVCNWIACLRTARRDVPVSELAFNYDSSWRILLPEDVQVETTADFFSTFFLPDLRALAFTFMELDLTAETLAPLTRFPSIRELRIGRRETLAAFIEAEEQLAARGQHLLPDLQLLILSDVAWKSHTNEALRQTEPSLAPRLDALLHKRKEDGVLLAHLVVESPMFLDGHDFSGLGQQGVVGKVECAKQDCVIWSCLCNICRKEQ